MHVEFASGRWRLLDLSVIGILDRLRPVGWTQVVFTLGRALVALAQTPTLATVALFSSRLEHLGPSALPRSSQRLLHVLRLCCFHHPAPSSCLRLEWRFCLALRTPRAVAATASFNNERRLSVPGLLGGSLWETSFVLLAPKTLVCIFVYIYIYIYILELRWPLAALARHGVHRTHKILHVCFERECP